MNAEFWQGWRSRGNCRSADPELFFPAAECGPVFEEQVAEAKAVCAACRVRRECLTDALVRIPYGIAGGLTPDERRGLVARRTVGARASEDRARFATSAAEAAAAGVALLAQGRATRSVARVCGVSERTVLRWAARARRAGVPA